VHAISDGALAELYATSTWVSGLRHVEGFELPAAEGLVCGARPLVFDQPGMREWYRGLGVFVAELQGEKLIRLLTELFHQSPLPVSQEEREEALRRFDWERIAKGFWEALLK
jgi:glycosyltransferase involved in cell wall biosynthesis